MARTAIEQNRHARTGYADISHVAMALSGHQRAFDNGAAMLFLERLNRDYQAHPDSFEVSPDNRSKWRNV
jgi:hypothetical protein